MANMATSPTNATTQTPRGPPPAGQKVNASEVGWLFVHEYYTFLNKEPSRLHCFYGPKSTLIHGTEGEQVKPTLGEKEIQEKIKELDLDNCRVLVTNVDSQSSLNGGIVIQVLGEMSNRSELSRKFAQTFFLAEQPNGYYVMNDIIRFLKEDDEVDEEVDEIEEETRPTVEEAVTNYEEAGSTSPTGTLVEEPINGRAVSETVTITITSGQVVTSTDESTGVAVNGTEVHDEVQAPVNTETIEPSSSTLTETSQSIDNGANVDQPRSIPEAPRPVHSAIDPQAASPNPVSNMPDQTQPTSSNTPGLVSLNHSASFKSVPNPDISQFPSPNPVNNNIADVPQNLPKQTVQTPKPATNNLSANSQATSTKPAPAPIVNSQPVTNSISSTAVDFQSPSTKNLTNHSQSTIITPTVNSQLVTTTTTTTNTTNTNTIVTVTNSLVNGQQTNVKQPAPNITRGQTYAQRSAPFVQNGQYNQASRPVASVGNKQSVSQRATSPTGRSVSPAGNSQTTPDPQRSVSPVEGLTPPPSESIHPTTSVQQTDPSSEDSTAKSVVVNGQPTTGEVSAQGDTQKSGQDSNQNAQVETPVAQSRGTAQQVNTQQTKSQDPPSVRTWATMAADDRGKWNNNALAEKKGHVAPVSAPVQKTAPQQQRQHTRDNQDRRQDGARGNNRRNSDTALSIYVKGVTQSMTREQLQSAFKTFGPISHLDVVHSKSCAFVEYNSAEAYKAALNAKSIKIGNESVFTEERRGRRGKPSRGRY